MKEILIINGSGGVGKDTFVDKLSIYAKVIHTSIVNPTKELAKKIGWNGGKTEKDRKFLSDMKVLIDEYNDGNYNQMKALMQDFRDGKFDAEILCIDMREKHQIERAKEEFGAKTVLVTRKAVPHITSNIADKGVFDIEYDYHIENDGTLYDLDKKAQEFVQKLKTIKYKKVIYVSHPYSGKQENLANIEKIMRILVKKMPNYLFLSPVHAFGFEYNFLPYEQGLNQCLWLLSKCDEMLVFGDYTQSRGCQREIQYCEENKIPYRLVGWNNL